uniref:Interleukin 2 receptor, alpha chain n=1 Tax=Nannospalax galili TaxID=1026970 RepID=A0A8C6QSL8_NANGA
MEPCLLMLGLLSFIIAPGCLTGIRMMGMRIATLLVLKHGDE